MMTKSIKISVETHELLSELASENDTLNDVIVFLIEYYREREEFSAKQADAYNRDIERFENGNLENLSELRLPELDKRIIELENEIRSNENDRTKKL